MYRHIYHFRTGWVHSNVTKLIFYLNSHGIMCITVITLICTVIGKKWSNGFNSKKTQLGIIYSQLISSLLHDWLKQIWKRILLTQSTYSQIIIKLQKRWLKCRVSLTSLTVSSRVSGWFVLGHLASSVHKVK